jgi:hypothetical protein
MGLSPMTHATSQSHESTVSIVNLLEDGVHVAGRPLHVFIHHSAQPPVQGDTSGGPRSTHGDVFTPKQGLTGSERGGYTAVLHRPPSAALAVRYHNEEHNEP